MRNARAMHERFMNASVSILPRVGGGVGEGVGASREPHSFGSRKCASTLRDLLRTVQGGDE